MQPRNVLAACGVVAFLLMGAAPNPAHAETYRPGLLRRVVMECELMVQGVVDSVWTSTTVTRGVERPATVVRIDVQSVLKGIWADQTLDAVLEGTVGSPCTCHVYDYEPGQDVIFCVDIEPQDGDICHLWVSTKSFVFRDGQWMSRDRKIVSIDDIQRELARLELGQIACDADAALVGTVVNAQEVEFDCDGWRSCVAESISVRVDEAWKGVARGEIIPVRAIRIGTNLDWWAPMQEVQTGQRYLMLLKRDDVGYYPFVGFNGFLKVRGDELVVNQDVIYPVSKADALRILAASAPDRN